MRGASLIARKLISKGFYTTGDKSAENEDRIVIRNDIFPYVTNEDDDILLGFYGLIKTIHCFTRLLLTEEVKSFSPFIYPIYDIPNQSNDLIQYLKIEGGYSPGVKTFVKYIDGSLQDSSFSKDRLSFYHSKPGYRFRSINATCNEAEFAFRMYSNIEGLPTYDVSIDNSGINIYNYDDLKLVFNADLKGSVNASRNYKINGTKVVGRQYFAINNPAPNLSSGSISNLPIGETYNQSEVQALRDQVELLRSVLESTRSQLVTALDALRAHGLIASSQSINSRPGNDSPFGNSFAMGN